ncbi:CMP-N-acetylneuraminate-poly-alpha-2,8-sialyltransferase-like [Lytechinus variegatus]|uniref:CMP-N-acetylneuraminate-poly-alpha-2, 8-sialyltransferase-like n=1 Tax=Lytechinus variegatus TaxID=7654 RepID=UPI001BB29D3D|nr:CMP-N-acetylneuraminate-poly-alpha-2,8-sialyltransferase-like [Lytechinus variegatus]
MLRRGSNPDLVFQMMTLGIQFLQRTMYDALSIKCTRKKVFCFLLALATSVCFGLMTSQMTSFRSPTYLWNSSSTSANLLLREKHHSIAMDGNGVQINCSCLHADLPPSSDAVQLNGQNITSKNNQTTANNQTTEKNTIESHRLVPKKGKTIMNNSLTGLLWNFQEERDQQLFLFENLLRQQWKANSTRTAILRQELANYRSELEDKSKIILHQKNVKIGQVVKFVFQGKEKKMTRDVYNKYLPKSDPLAPQVGRYSSCAVIGNSGSMLNSHCGQQIDKHDYVFRCNLAPLAPFKEDAGSKSNFTTMNPSMIFRNFQSLKNAQSLKKYQEALSQYEGCLWVPCYGFSGFLSVAFRAIAKFNKPKPKMVCGNPAHQKSVIDFWGERELNQRLSTGFYLVTTALQLCDEVQLYGFWPFSFRYSNNKTDVPYHYFDDLSVSDANSVHSMDKEFSLLVQLHTLGILHMNVGPCS